MIGFMGPGGPHDERRAVPRFALIATADVIEPVSQTRMSGRVSEIGLHGCYIDILNTLPAGTDVRVRISTDRGSFESAGKIVYAQENMGMGIGFVEPAQDQLRVLESWLADLAGHE